MSDLEKERLNENPLEKAVLEKLQDVLIQGLKSVFLGVKSRQIVLGISKKKHLILSYFFYFAYIYIQYNYIYQAEILINAQ